jgi:hypothetical protein
MKIETTIVEGQTIDHKDVIHTHCHGITFKFWDRLKFLFGIKMAVSMTIYTMNDQVDVVKSITTCHIPDFIKKCSQSRGGFPVDQLD